MIYCIVISSIVLSTLEVVKIKKALKYVIAMRLETEFRNKLIFNEFLIPAFIVKLLVVRLFERTYSSLAKLLSVAFEKSGKNQELPSIVEQAVIAQ